MERGDATILEVRRIEIQDIAQLIMEGGVRRSNGTIRQVANHLLDVVGSVGGIAGEVLVCLGRIAVPYRISLSIASHAGAE